MLALTPFNKNQLRKQSGYDLMNFYDLFDDFLDDNFSNMRSFKNDTFKLDVKDQEQEYVVEAEMPGVTKDQIHLDYQGNQLLIRVEKQEQTEEEKDNYIHRERKFSSMQRSIMLKDIEPSSIEASLENGVLKIKLPKTEQKPSKYQIEVK